MRAPDEQVAAVVARAPADCRLRRERGDDPYIEARRAMEICNACRYCEGFCAVFPAVTRRDQFRDGDLNYLANLCHNCRACFYSCPYVPPHQFGINVPRVFSQIRMRSYGAYCFPSFLARMFPGNGRIFAATSLAGTIIAIGLALALIDRPAMLRPVLVPGDFYAIVPYRVMVCLGLGTALWSLVALSISARRAWIDIAAGRFATRTAVFAGIRDALSLKNLGATGNRGCNDRDERYANVRRRFHHSLFYGFMLCFASTCLATVYAHYFGLEAPYPLASAPVQLGLWGGLAMLVGASGLIWLKATGDPALTSSEATGADYALLLVLAAASLTGLALLCCRGTSYAGILLTTHLGVVLTFFLMVPYSKMVHGLYRLLALIYSAQERQDEGGT